MCAELILKNNLKSSVTFRRVNRLRDNLFNQCLNAFRVWVVRLGTVVHFREVFINSLRRVIGDKCADNVTAPNALDYARVSVKVDIGVATAKQDFRATIFFVVTHVKFNVECVLKVFC